MTKKATAKKQPKKAVTARVEGDKSAPVKPAPAMKEIAVGPIKGRPMLQWFGKRPLQRVTAFPAQKVESFGPTDANANLLFHGDNKEVLAHLLANGYRGKVNLIYIDPPFDSGADYVRKVTLRGKSAISKIEGEGYTLGEQVQYEDIWANDNYLQFMYERLMLLKELLAEDGILTLHCDWRKSHHLRVLLDETLGSDQFRNEVFWYFYNKMHDDRKGILPRATNSLLIYAKGSGSTFNRLTVPRESIIRQLKRVKINGVLVNLKDESGGLVYQDSDAKTLDNIWPIPLIPPADIVQKTDYPTQKPEALLDLLQLIYSKPGDLVLDCFIGSGTTAAVAQKLGRRWIGCDINKGAIQTTAKRLQSIIEEQQAAPPAPQQLPGMDADPSSTPKPASRSFHVWRVNDYDLQIQHNEAVALACEHIGVERTRNDTFFDGQQGKRLVKIVPFNHPLSPTDLEDVSTELKARKNEERDILLVALGMERACAAWLENWNRLRKKGDVPNKIEVIELRTDPKYGKFIAHRPASARVNIKRVKNTIKVEIKDFASPSILERLSSQAGLLKPHIEDWRSMVDSVMIDPAYDGAVFHIALADVPEKKTDFVTGTYELPAPKATTTIAIKITDMLGEEVFISEKV